LSNQTGFFISPIQLKEKIIMKKLKIAVQKSGRLHDESLALLKGFTLQDVEKILRQRHKAE
jgi:hypothetical protein